MLIRGAVDTFEDEKILGCRYLTEKVKNVS